MNLDLIKEILTTEYDYWLVAKLIKNEYSNDKDEVIFIGIPKEIRRGLKYEEITLKDVETLYNSYLDLNIHINADYAPFQIYLPFREIDMAFSIKKNVKEFLTKALQLKSSNFHDYKPLIDECNKEEE